MLLGDVDRQGDRQAGRRRRPRSSRCRCARRAPSRTSRRPDPRRPSTGRARCRCRPRAAVPSMSYAMVVTSASSRAGLAGPCIQLVSVGRSTDIGRVTEPYDPCQALAPARASGRRLARVTDPGPRCCRSIIGSAILPVQITVTVLLLRSTTGRFAAVAWLAGMTAVRLAQGVVFGIVLGTGRGRCRRARPPRAHRLDAPARDRRPVPRECPSQAARRTGRGRPAAAVDGDDVDRHADPGVRVRGGRRRGEPEAMGVHPGRHRGHRGGGSRPRRRTRPVPRLRRPRGSIHLSLVAIAYASPRRAVPALDRVTDLLARYNRPLMIGLGVVFGTWFLLKALAGFGVI